MDPLAWHVVLRLEDCAVIAPSVPARRRLARAVIEVGASRGLLAFRATDTRVHLLLAAPRPVAGRTAQALACALLGRLDLAHRFATASVRPLATRADLERTFHTLLRSGAAPGEDPWHDASILPDLLGMRVTGAPVVAAARARLPRTDQGRLVPLLGVPRLEPATDPDLVPEAAAAAAALDAVGDASGAGRAARRAALEVLAPSCGPTEAAARLGIHRATVYRMLERPARPGLVRAIRLQVGFRSALAAGGFVEGRP